MQSFLQNQNWYESITLIATFWDLRLYLFISAGNEEFFYFSSKKIFCKRNRKPRFANFIDEWSHCDFCFTNFGVILEYLESSITTKKAIFRLSNTWSWHVYTIVMDTRSSCGGPLTWKAQIYDGGHRVNFERTLRPSSCFCRAV